MAWKNRGIIDEAMEQYQIALRMELSHLGIRYNLANAYEMRSFCEKAEEYRLMSLADRFQP